jgi:uncharacterized protein (TIGR03435 family)
MMRRVLEDRFSLRVTREMREWPVYLLIKANRDGRLGSGLKPSTLDCPTPAPGMRGPCTARITQDSIEGVGADWVTLNLPLQLGLDRPVIDQTGLAGRFDVKLEWALDPLTSSGDRVQVFTAVTEQLGLKLEPARAPIEVLVIDSVERPTPD